MAPAATTAAVLAQGRPCRSRRNNDSEHALFRGHFLVQSSSTRSSYSWGELCREHLGGNLPADGEATMAVKLLLTTGLLLSCGQLGCYASSSASEYLLGRSDATAAGAPETTTPPDCAPTTSRGECNVIHQCECPDSYWCVWKVAPDSMSSCEAYEQCIAVPHSGLDPGQACDSVYSVHPCRPGSTCLDSDFHRPSHYGTCWEFCRTDWDCSVPGSRCSVPAAISVNGCPDVVNLPINLCSQD